VDTPGSQATIAEGGAAQPEELERAISGSVARKVLQPLPLPRTRDAPGYVMDVAGPRFVPSACMMLNRAVLAPGAGP